MNVALGVDLKRQKDAGVLSSQEEKAYPRLKNIKRTSAAKAALRRSTFGTAEAVLLSKTNFWRGRHFRRG